MPWGLGACVCQLQAAALKSAAIADVPCSGSWCGEVCPAQPCVETTASAPFERMPGAGIRLTPQKSSMLLADFSGSFNSEEDADVLLHLSTSAASARKSKKNRRKQQQEQQHDRTYHAHALLLKHHSLYFKACLTDNWQQPKARRRPGRPEKKRKSLGSKMSGSAASAAAPRYELVEHLEAAELDAMEQLLRLMYCPKVPADIPPEQLLKVLQLADRYQAAQCSELLLTHLGGLGKGALSYSLAMQLLSMPPGLKELASFQSVMRSCQDVVVERFGDVPAVIQDTQMRQQFCALPFEAVLAWAGSDELQVHSENCVVHLLTTWAAAQKKQEGQAVTAAQLEQLAKQVRVLHLGPAYLFFVLPNLDWFKGCSGMAHLHLLQAYRGKDCRGTSVYPAPVCGKPTDVTWKWEGPAVWVASPRKVAPVAAAATASWEMGSAELQLLYNGKLVHVAHSVHAYINGFHFELSVQQRCVEGSGLRKTLGMYCDIPVEVMSEHGLPWLDSASVSVRSVDFRVRGPPPAGVKSAAIQLSKFSCKDPSWGRSDMLSQSELSMQELVAPLLVEGKLHLEMVVSGVDLPV